MAKRTLKATALSFDAKTMLPVLLSGIEVVVDPEAQQIAVMRHNEPPIVLVLPDLFPQVAPTNEAAAAKPTRRNGAKAEEVGKVEAKPESAGRTVRTTCNHPGRVKGSVCTLPRGHRRRHSYAASA